MSLLVTTESISNVSFRDSSNLHNELSPLAKSPLRYPGGKARALKTLLPLIPEFDEFREPFFGGGSVLLALKQLSPSKRYWANDLNEDVFSFWKCLRDNPAELIGEIKSTKAASANGRELFARLKTLEATSDMTRAVRFFVLNRVTFSGTIESGGYSQQAFDKRFTASSIARLSTISKVLPAATLTNLDYEVVLKSPGENVFIFLDPPYLTATKSRLYGKGGVLHIEFDHERFAANVANCKHHWMITYDDSPEVRDLFVKLPGVYFFTWEQHYAMGSHGKNPSPKGQELVITNYPIQGVHS